MNTVINVNTKKIRFETAPNLYGLFFEDINRAADGGLYPEMIRNRAFEDSIPPENCVVSESGNIIVNPGGWPGSFMNGEGMDDWANKVQKTTVPGWYAVNASMRIDTSDVLNSNRLAALHVEFKDNGAIYNIGYDGISVKKDEYYNLLFFAKTDAKMCLMAGFVSEAGEILGQSAITVDGKGYRKYYIKIKANCDADNVRFQLSSEFEVVIKFGFTSLLPDKTFKGHGLREDLALALKNTNSKFMRFPGGCVVEGINEENALSFSRSIGPVWERPSSYLMWHYRTTNGLGFHEYLQLCEDLCMDAMYVCNCGISCQARHGTGFEPKLVEKYLDEAVNAVEYALGDKNTVYGAMRIAAGHRAPFNLKYLEIGNENFGPVYNERYKKFYQKLHSMYPDLKLIANVHVERDGLEAQIVDEHYYNTPEYFIENKNLFNDYDRNGPEIFIGEYAVNGGNTIGSMECALAEAVFLTGVEKNQDIVKLSAYAPLLQNSNYTAWLPNLIVFNQTKVYGIPSYSVVSLFGKYRGKLVVDSDSSGKCVPPAYRGIPGIMCEKEGLMFRNAMINGKPVDIQRKIYGDIEKTDDGIKLINGDARHRYTGKNEEWNLAFEKFIGAGPDVDNPVLWVAFGKEDLEEFTFEVDLKFSEDNPVTLSIWNYYPNTDVGCNEPRDTGWNLRSVRNQIWKIADKKSALRAPRFFDPPLTSDEIVDVDIDYSKYNHYKIVAKAGYYECYLNDILIQKKELQLLPVISEVVTVDDENIYVKVVNVSEESQNIAIDLDCQVKADYTLAYVSGKKDAINSFENPDNVTIKQEARTGAASKFEFTATACSVNVLILKRCEE